MWHVLANRWDAIPRLSSSHLGIKCQLSAVQVRAEHLHQLLVLGRDLGLDVRPIQDEAIHVQQL